MNVEEWTRQAIVTMALKFAKTNDTKKIEEALYLYHSILIKHARNQFENAVDAESMHRLLTKMGE